MGDFLALGLVVFVLGVVVFFDLGVVPVFVFLGVVVVFEGAITTIRFESDQKRVKLKFLALSCRFFRLLTGLGF